ncbi:hypothetical protein [Anabaena sp. PCC 7108]|uniref:hypothetical protein n=1 Tax=Anabaena sp. PCC 7108 TaxID=163908 RepID=UPI00034642A3|nr:hypothetical protein [Anabaena sp. PCC 7108]
MNPIELEWQHLKKDELSGQMLKGKEYLAYAVINGVKTRGERKKHSTEHIKFNN